MERDVTALLPRGPATTVLPLEHHPSFPNGLPAIIAPRRPDTRSDALWLLDRIAETGDVRYFTTLARYELAILARVSRDTP